MVYSSILINAHGTRAQRPPRTVFTSLLEIAVTRHFQDACPIHVSRVTPLCGAQFDSKLTLSQVYLSLSGKITNSYSESNFCFDATSIFVAQNDICDRAETSERAVASWHQRPPFITAVRSRRRSAPGCSGRPERDLDIVIVFVVVFAVVVRTPHRRYMNQNV